jgi:hypothetical protein
VYYVDGDKLRTIPIAETEVISSKSRTVLKVLSPVPIVPGKSTVEIKGETAALRVTGTTPEFYFRLADEERFALIKLTRKKNARLVENVAILPVTNEVVEDLKQVATFKKQIGDRSYKIWPEKPLEPGEYALVEYTEGSLNLQLWDFGVGPAGK